MILILFIIFRNILIFAVFSMKIKKIFEKLVYLIRGYHLIRKKMAFNLKNIKILNNFLPKLNQKGLFRLSVTPKFLFSSFEPQESYIAEEDLYIPKTKIEWQNNESIIYEFSTYKTARMSIMLLSAMFFSFFGYSIKKFIDYKNRSYIGLGIYGLASIFFFNRARNYPEVFSWIIKEISLCNDGKNIKFVTNKYFLLRRNHFVNISKIQRPNKQSLEENRMAKFGYPIVIDAQMFVLPRDEANINKEILPVVLNGKYIKTD